MRPMERQLISVIIPCFNHGEFIEEAINSVLKQKYQHFEIIVVDDGSSDINTIKFLKNYRNKKVRIYKTSNNGAASARNYGFKKAKGDFIQFLDADDLIDENKFSDQIEIFKTDTEIDVCYTNYSFFIQEKNEFMKPPIRVKLKKNVYKDFLYNWQRGLSIPIHTALFRKRNWLKKTPFVPTLGVAEDWVMWVTLAREQRKFVFLDKNYATYRIHENNTTHNKSYVLFGVARALSYIAENLVDEGGIKEFNVKTEKYLDKLIKDIYIPEMSYNLKVAEKKLIEIQESVSWKLIWPIRMTEKFILLIRKQGLILTLRNITTKLKNKILKKKL